MSLSKTKKRLIGSLYKRKKIKISDQSEPEPPLPSNPALRTRDAIGRLQFTKSLPEQLNQSETLSVPRVSFKSLSNIDTSPHSFELYHFEKSQSKNVFTNSRKAQQIPQESTSHPTYLNESNIRQSHYRKSNSDYLKNIKLTSSDNNSTLVSPHKKRSNSFCPHLVTRTSYVTEQEVDTPPQTLLEIATLHAQKSQKEGGLSKPSISSLDVNDSTFDKEISKNLVLGSSLIADDGLKNCCVSLTNDLIKCINHENCNLKEKFKEDDTLITKLSSKTNGQSSKQEFPVSHKEKASVYNTLKTILLTNEISSDFSNKPMNDQDTVPYKTHTIDKREHRAHVLENQNVDDKDNSLIKKIQFFESYNKPDNENCKSEINARKCNHRYAKHQTRAYKNNIVVSDECTSGSQANTLYNSDVHVTSNNQNIKPQSKTPLSMKYSKAALQRQRLNFTKFRSSDSIPEAEVPFSRGYFFDMEYYDSDVDITMTDNESTDVDVFEEDSDERISNIQECHHPQCTQTNSDVPLMLCRKCDLELHENSFNYGHLVLDIKQQPKFKKSARRHNGVVTPSSLSDMATSSSEERIGRPAQGSLINHSQTFPRTIEPQKKLTHKISKSKSGNKKDFNLEKRKNGLYSNLLSRKGSVNNETNSVQRSGRVGSLMEADGAQTIFPPRMHSASDADKDNLQSGSVIYASQKKPLVRNASITLRFSVNSSSEEDLVTIPASPGRKLWEAVGPVLEERQLDIHLINVFLENSLTPLPMECQTTYLAEKTLEIKEKDVKELEQCLGTPPPTSIISWPKRTSKPSGRGSRRDSAGIASLLLEAPPIRQRRGSLQLHFREHVSSKSDVKKESSKGNDDSFLEASGRRSGSNTVDDDMVSPSGPAGSSSGSKRSRSNKQFTRNGTNNKEKERQDQLLDLLCKYNLQAFDDSTFEIEASWKLVVANYEEMTERQQKHQEAVWELLQTEMSYIKQIKFIIEIFQNCLHSVKQESYLTEIESEKLFSNIDKVFECNCMFWQHHLLPALQQSRETHAPLNPIMFKDAFVEHFPVLFQVYSKYLIEHKSCLEYAKSCTDNSELFRIFIQWAETQKQCKRLRLTDILVQPMSRLTKYSLLLQAILKYTDDEKDKAALQAMIQAVEQLCYAVNSSLKRREEYERLAAVGKTIESFDSLETPNEECAKIIQEYTSAFNLLAPIPDFKDGSRSLLFQSNLEMKEGKKAKIEVDCLLFTDLLLICKSNKKIERYKIIRPPMRLDQLVVSELKDKWSFLVIYVNEYKVPLSAFTFHSDPGAIKGWLDKLRQAQKVFKEKEFDNNFQKIKLRSDATSAQNELDNLSLGSQLIYGEYSAIPRSDSISSLDYYRYSHHSATDIRSKSIQSELPRSSSLISFRNSPCDIPAQNNGPRIETDLHPISAENTSQSFDGQNQNFKENNFTELKLLRSPSDISASSVESFSNVNSFPPSSIDSTIFNKEFDTAKSGSLSDVASNKLKEKHSSLLCLQMSDEFEISGNENPTKMIISSKRTGKQYRATGEILEQNNSHKYKDTSVQNCSGFKIDTDSNSNPIAGNSEQIVPSANIRSSSSPNFLLQKNEESDDAKAALFFMDSSPTIVEHDTPTMSVSDFEERLINDDNVDGNSRNHFLSLSKYSKSKSTSDLVEMLNKTFKVSEPTDGIASVDMATNNYHKKLTHSDIVRLQKMKHQILSDANTESSEV